MGGALVLGIIFQFIQFIMPHFGKINPLKKLALYILAPLAIIISIINIRTLWIGSDFSYTKQILVVIMGSGAIIYTTALFCMLIHKKSEDYH